jgi:hypothetical protein
MQKCSYCGRENNDTSTNCPECGTLLESTIRRLDCSKADADTDYHEIKLLSAGSFLRSVKAPSRASFSKVKPPPSRVSFSNDTMHVHCRVGPNLVPLAILILPYFLVITLFEIMHADLLAKIFGFGFWGVYWIYAHNSKRNGFEVKKEHLREVVSESIFKPAGSKLVAKENLRGVVSDGHTVDITFARAPLAGIKKMRFLASSPFFPAFEAALPGVLPRHLCASSTQEATNEGQQ